MTDTDLLRDYVERKQETAFQTLVQKYVHLVYGAALRQTNDPAVAEETVQSVFITLAQKAAFLEPGNLAGWLYKVAVLKARERRREEHRRKLREEAAIALGTTMKEDDSLLKFLTSVLDDALLELREKDRRVLLLRYFEEKSLREVGESLGVAEDAAQKRVAKALESLTRVFQRRGYAVPVTAVSAAALRCGAQAAPVGLAATVSQAALLKAGAASMSGITLYLFKLMSLTQPQILALSVTIGLIPIVSQWKIGQGLEARTRPLQSQIALIESDLASSRNQRGELKRQLAQIQADIQGLEKQLTASVPKPAGNPYLWSDGSPYVNVPKELLARIKIPALGEDGLMMDEMARALELTEAQKQQVNDALSGFHSRFAALEAANFKPTTEHPKSFSVSGLKDQKSFIRAAFPEAYDSMRGELETSLKELMGSESTAYFLKNAEDSRDLSPDYGRSEKRITIMLPEQQQPGGGPYVVGEEYRMDGGTWGNAVMSTVDREEDIKSPQLLKVIAEWKKN